jgi:hypothetical protein
MRSSAVVAIMMVVPSGGQIEAAMVPMPVSLTDPNSDAADPDIGTFGDDDWFVAVGQRTGNRRHCQEWNKKESKRKILHDTLLCRDARRPAARQNARLVFMKSV